MIELADIIALLPENAASQITEYGAGITEVRLRAGMPVSLTYRTVNKRLMVVLSRHEIEEIFIALCEGSVHACEATIKEGYVIYRGCRVGICGEYSPSGTLRYVTGLCIRIPHHISGIASKLVKMLAERNFTEGAVIYSLPGAGKTTLLRDLAVTVSSPPYLKRVAVIDTRGELFDRDIMKGCLIDALSGVDKTTGIELATRTLSPEILICDEIGSSAEADAILAAQNTGVPLIASAHAASLEQLLARLNIKPLIDAGIFDIACGIVPNHNRLEIERFNEGLVSVNA